jgi:hypothetical protein
VHQSAQGLRRAIHELLPAIAGKSTVEKILKNPIYYGAFRWQGRLRDGSHPPLISKDLFDKACAAPHGNARPYINHRGFAFNLLTCGDCGCKVLGEEKKKRFVYYHCTFSKGRHNGWGYVPEREIARLFEPTVKAVSLDEEIVEWLEDALKESDKSSRSLSENRLNSLQRSGQGKIRGFLGFMMLNSTETQSRKKSLRSKRVNTKPPLPRSSHKSERSETRILTSTRTLAEPSNSLSACFLYFLRRTTKKRRVSSNSWLRTTPSLKQATQVSFLHIEGPST